MGGEVGGAVGGVWTHCAVAHSKTSQSLVKAQMHCLEGVWHKSREAQRSPWHEKLRPDPKKAVQIPDCAATIINTIAITIARTPTAPLDRTIMKLVIRITSNMEKLYLIICWAIMKRINGINFLYESHSVV